MIKNHVIFFLVYLTYAWMYGRTDGRTDGWMDGWMDEWVDKKSLVPILNSRQVRMD